MNNAIAEIGNHDLRNAVKVLYCAAEVLKNLPRLQTNLETQNDLIQSAQLAIESVRIVLGDVSHRLARLERLERLEGEGRA